MIDNTMLLDFGFRFGAIIVMTLVALAFSLSKARFQLKVAIVLLVLGGIGHLMAASPYLYSQFGIAQPVLKFLSQTAVLWFWFFALTLFEDQIPKWLFSGLTALFTLMWMMMWIQPQWRDTIIIPHHLLSVILIVHIIWLAVSGLKDDLIQSRRQLRIWLVITIGLIVLFTSLSVSDGNWPTGQIEWSTVSAISILGAAMFALLTLLQVDHNLIAAESDPDETAPEGNLSPSERVLKKKLLECMESGYFVTTGLTVYRLAAKLDVPDHKLRNLINGKLGYRNFSSFLNHYRVAKAKEWLAHPDFVDTPIFTLAMDLGYASLAPFNRAFRQESGMSPSDFRQSEIP